MNWKGLYAQKIIGLHTLAKTCGTTVEQLCAKYDGEQWGTINKGATFRNAMTGKYTGSQAVYLIQSCNLQHHKDKRLPLQYATDLIIGWLSEDAIITAIQSHGHNCEPIGSDKERNFLNKNDISHIADIQIGTTPIELVFDYTNHWVIHDKIDLRDNKKEHLQKHKIKLFGVAPRAQKCFVLSPEDLDSFTYGEIPAYGKSGWTKTGIKSMLQNLPEVLHDF